jgi:hypothetical protein
VSEEKGLYSVDGGLKLAETGKLQLIGYDPKQYSAVSFNSMDPEIKIEFWHDGRILLNGEEPKDFKQLKDAYVQFLKSWGKYTGEE